jgi:hypothetical protein
VKTYEANNQPELARADEEQFKRNEYERFRRLVQQSGVETPKE